MKTQFWSLLAALAVSMFVIGCQGGSTNNPPAKGSDKADAETTIRTNLEKLSPEDRKLAEAQGFCAVETNNPLGSMGVPRKIEIQGQPVFLCCDGCETRAKAHADRTLAKVKELKDKRATTPGK